MSGAIRILSAPVAPEAGIVLIGPARWLRGLVGPPLVGAALISAAALAGFEPGDGGWPPVLAVLGGLAVLWAGLVGLAVPNQLVLSDTGLVQRTRRHHIAVAPADIQDVRVVRPAFGSPRLEVAARAGRIRIALGLLGPEARRVLVEQLGRVGVRPSLAASGSSLDVTGRPGRTRAQAAGRGLIVGAIALNAVAGLLRLATG